MSTPWLFWYTLLVLGAGCCMGYRWRRTDHKARVADLQRELAAARNKLDEVCPAYNARPRYTDTAEFRAEQGRTRQRLAAVRAGREGCGAGDPLASVRPALGPDCRGGLGR